MVGIVCSVDSLTRRAIIQDDVDFDAGMKIVRFWDSIDSLVSEYSKNEELFANTHPNREMYRGLADYYIVNMGFGTCWIRDDPLYIKEICAVLKKYSLYEKYLPQLILNSLGFDKIQKSLIDGLGLDALEALIANGKILNMSGFGNYLKSRIDMVYRNENERNVVLEDSIGL